MDSANDVSPRARTGRPGQPDGLDSSPNLADPDSLTAEERRLREARAGVPWRGWGPYLSERGAGAAHLGRGRMPAAPIAEPWMT